MKCICVKNCFNERRYRPGEVAFFDELPKHFVSAGDYAIENDRKEAAAMSPLRKSQAENKKLQSELRLLREQLKVPTSKPAPKARV